jgi:hypothetical protein
MKTEDKKAEDKFVRSLRDVQELETFLRDLLLHLATQPKRPAHGEDLTPYFKTLKRSVPESLRGAPVTWDSRPDFTDAELEGGTPLVLVGPGHPEALGLTIGCIRIWRFKICLECGWFYCRIVIKGRF